MGICLKEDIIRLQSGEQFKHLVMPESNYENLYKQHAKAKHLQEVDNIQQVDNAKGFLIKAEYNCDAMLAIAMIQRKIEMLEKERRYFKGEEDLDYEDEEEYDEDDSRLDEDNYDDVYDEEDIEGFVYRDKKLLAFQSLLEPNIKVLLTLQEVSTRVLGKCNLRWVKQKIIRNHIGLMVTTHLLLCFIHWIVFL